MSIRMRSAQSVAYERFLFSAYNECNEKNNKKALETNVHRTQQTAIHSIITRRQCWDLWKNLGIKVNFYVQTKHCPFV